MNSSSRSRTESMWHYGQGTAGKDQRHREAREVQDQVLQRRLQFYHARKEDEDKRPVPQVRREDHRGRMPEDIGRLFRFGQLFTSILLPRLVLRLRNARIVREHLEDPEHHFYSCLLRCRDRSTSRS